MKSSKVWLKILVLIFAMGFVFTTGCCKKKPVDTEPATAGKEGISEDELAAKRKAEQEAMLKKAAMQKFVNEDVYFDFDDASIRTDAKATLKDKADFLKANPGVSVTIEGHCDERGTEAYNLALGERRAQSIKTFLVNAGIDKSRLQTISYGEEKPVDPGKNEAAWAKNRRGHFRVD
ncbi:MAG: peptidoglycan-associated lipoprotein Pal [Desulfobacterales bacterium]|jgi:peptidoglycan-associated lipoprotein|nr:peptidoglycan-associated lipoprotein Pal [Desulfobacterales bacterium]